MAGATGPSGLIDSDVLIDAERGKADALALMTTHMAAGGVQISIVSAMELIQGCRNGLELRNVQNFLSGITCIPVTAAISNQARHWMEQFCLSHRLLINDALIGATALDLGLPLLTKNVKHFQMLPGITVQKPY